MPSLVYMVATRIWAALLTMIPLYLAALFSSLPRHAGDRHEVLLALIRHLHALLPVSSCRRSTSSTASSRRWSSPSSSRSSTATTATTRAGAGRRGRGNRQGDQVVDRRRRRTQPLHVPPHVGRRRHCEHRRMTTDRYIVGSSPEGSPSCAPGSSSASCAYGAYDDYYYLTADLDRAGQQLPRGADVRTKGVDIGSVTGIELVDRHAASSCRSSPSTRCPTTPIGSIELKTPLGAKYVDLQYDPGTRRAPLADGDSLERRPRGAGARGPARRRREVLEAIDPQNIGTIIHELSRGAEDRGDTIAAGIDANADLSDPSLRR